MDRSRRGGGGGGGDGEDGGGKRAGAVFVRSTPAFLRGLQSARLGEKGNLTSGGASGGAADDGSDWMEHAVVVEEKPRARAARSAGAPAPAASESSASGPEQTRPEQLHKEDPAPLPSKASAPTKTATLGDAPDPSAASSKRLISTERASSLSKRTALSFQRDEEEE